MLSRKPSTGTRLEDNPLILAKYMSIAGIVALDPLLLWLVLAGVGSEQSVA